MSTHSVGYHPEASLWLDQIAVFIELTDKAFVAHAEAFNGKGDSIHFATKRFSSVLLRRTFGRSLAPLCHRLEH
ncbi:hypothetical protein X743_11905 [Mesorhizobium sp. LNHC252B00]|nr:hypothetical protein X743_11905 [Mesorhizobium sp. LNHC252B00]